MRFVAGLGFHGLQLGPQGETTAHDPSPYDATLFSRSTLSISLARLVDDGLLSRDALDRAAATRPEGGLQRASHASAHAAVETALATSWQRARADPGLQERLAAFAIQHAQWLESAELYQVLATSHGDADWRQWPQRDRMLFARDPPEDPAPRRAELRASGTEQIGLFRFAQLVAHEQHRRFRAEAHRLGLRLCGDLQIGISHRDLWSHRNLLLGSIRMGAPPSRTNPEGQAWGYGVLHPDLYGTRARPGPALEFVRRRARKLLDEFDGLRVDHPHGLIDPWVYPAEKEGSPDLRAATELRLLSPARLFSSPERPELARWAIARPEQIDRSQPPYGDGWVRDLTEEQIGRYAMMFDALVDAAADHGLPPSALIVEVLSTQPHPVRRVLERHGLGRFRVTQKASMLDASDVYRSENARPQDWIMVGTHDTEPIWRVAERWTETEAAAERAAYLSRRLVPDERARSVWAQRVASSARAFARAQLADLFVGPAENVMIFFSDLLGHRETYNRPGTISPENWTLRVPPQFEAEHRRAAREGAALDLPAALATAIRARGRDFESTHREVLAALDEIAGPPPDAPPPP